MTDKILQSRAGKVGVIILNRPKAINALDSEMIRAITQAFEGFLADPKIEVILFEGEGERGFCSGGDVRVVRQSVLDGDLAVADRFFADEYALNKTIATSVKPVIALTHGVVMGGGIGLAGHAGYRITAEQSRFAMPESAIGLMCDVGVNAILANVPLHRALAFCMTGSAVGSADALALGLTDCIVAKGDLIKVREALVDGINDGDARAAIAKTMQTFARDGGDATFVAQADQLEDAYGAIDAEAIVCRLKEMDDNLQDAAAHLEILQGRSPSSLVAIVLSHIFARTHGDISKVLATDLKLGGWMIRQPDFIEGVRAVLVDKDQSAKWRPETLKSVDSAAIKANIAY